MITEFEIKEITSQIQDAVQLLHKAFKALKKIEYDRRYKHEKKR